MHDAVVVGAGPNGLAAAVTLARAGLSVTVFEQSNEIGGGARTAELTLPGLKHDTCSGIHPFAVASPFLSSLPLQQFGLRWCYPKIEAAHPLDDGSAAALYRSIDNTADALGPDGWRWHAVFGSLVQRVDALTADSLGPLLRVPRHPFAMARLGLRAMPPASWLAKCFRTEHARALFLGSAAHHYHALTRLGSSAIGVMNVVVGHRYGWPVAAGGSGAITSALAAMLTSLGGEVVTNTRIRSLSDVPRARITMFDTTPAAFADIAAGQPGRHRRYRRFTHGPAAFKVDFAVRQGVPWTAPEARRAGTVHAIGSAAEVISAESAVAAGVMPARPFVLVGQQYLADPSRSVADLHPVYAYAHVPHGYSGDATGAIIGQIERFAPGFAARIAATHVTTPTQLQTANPNYVGGDIVGGANSFKQILGRPVLSTNPYSTGVSGMYLCSASTPPGAGTHGMCGHRAAQRALADAGF